MCPERRCHYVLSSHWDREWYQSFQNFRYRLVQLIDHLLDGFGDGRLKGPFQTDGQSIILEDYLEVRPERREAIVAHARKGNFVIGPWYVLPDEFLVSGESILRNIRYGRAVARSLGAEPSNSGFVCDLFGHNSQMPQIFTGFGIRGGFIWRGTNAFTSRNVIWVGADGTELPCYRFGRIGYCDFAIDVRQNNRQDLPFDAEQAARNLEQFIDREAKLTDTDPILLFDGADHQDWDDRVYGVLAETMDEEGRAFPIVHSSLDAYLDEMLPQVSRIQTRLSGELREPGINYTGKDEQMMIPGVGSSRVKHKQANSECEALLCQWAEPTSALASFALGVDFPQGFLDVAWKWLLQNHPHDSICGCSIDTVHQDMVYRFSQCRQIAERLTLEATQRIAASIEGDIPDNEIRVVVFNPTARPVNEPVDLALRLPTEWPKYAEFFAYEAKTSFTIHGLDGEEIPYQLNGQRNDRAGYRIHRTKFTEGIRSNEVQVTIPLEVPAAGYTTLVVRRGEERKPTRHPGNHGLASSHHSLENELLAVTVEPNGTLTVRDKRSGQTYSGLLAFEDCADIGDGWYHGVAVNDQTFSSVASRADVAVVHNGPKKATLRIRTTMNVPARFDFHQLVRSDSFAEVIVDSRVTLRAGLDRIEVETTIHNTADDHRMRLLLPSETKAEEYWSDTPFDVVKRKIALREDNHLYRELEIEPKPMRSFAAIQDEERGLAVISSGLLECGVQDRPERPIALTLFRGTGRTVMTDGEPDGQLRGPLTFRYWILPLEGEFDSARLLVLGQQLAAELRTVQTAPADVPLYREGEGALPPRAGLFRVDGPAVATSARQVGAGLEIRVFNPTERPVEAAIRLLDGFRPEKMPRKALLVDFESRVLDSNVDFDGGVARVALGPKKIATVRLQ